MRLISPGAETLENPDEKSQAKPCSRILLVEDDTAIRQLGLEVLIASGYQVDTAEDGEAAWQTLHNVSQNPGGYDLMITDNNMPKLTGIGLIQKIRSERMPLTVILASGTTPPNIMELKLAALLLKPFSPYQLVQTVKTVLNPDNNDLKYFC